MRRRIPTRVSPWFAVLLVLFAVGFVTAAAMNPKEFIAPLAVVAIVFLLYKFPPDRWARAFRRRPPHEQPFHRQRAPVRTTSPGKKERKVIPFRVIEGKKNREGRPPRYP
jgi:hypothetical protein